MSINYFKLHQQRKRINLTIFLLILIKKKTIRHNLNGNIKYNNFDTMLQCFRALQL